MAKWGNVCVYMREMIMTCWSQIDIPYRVQARKYVSTFFLSFFLFSSSIEEINREDQSILIFVCVLRGDVIFVNAHMLTEIIVAAEVFTALRIRTFVCYGSRC